ncbi:Guanylate kinase 2 [Spatholobus suberectus]|nr:Guanylate kinase 2 [Spatholobus suberectus]
MAIISKLPLQLQAPLPSPYPLIIVINGPSCVSKDAFIVRLCKSHHYLHFDIIATMHPRCSAEVDRKDYLFLEMVELEKLLEYMLFVFVAAKSEMVLMERLVD